jgi:Fur family transcriptional regulator, iron response regulator
MRPRSGLKSSTSVLAEGERAGGTHTPSWTSPNIRALLLAVGVRPTRQRIMLGCILFGSGDRHITAEMLYQEAANAGVPVSLATVYNTLHQFLELGLLRQIGIGGAKTYFDTNLSHHHHFFLEEENNLLDIPSTEAVLRQEPVPPNGYEIVSIDMLVRLRRTTR